MHQAKKGNQWHFGMKAHIGADRDSKLVHAVLVTAADMADITKTAELLQVEEKQVHATVGCTGVEKRWRSWHWDGRSAVRSRANGGDQGAGRTCGEGNPESGGEGESLRAGVRGASVPHREEPVWASESAVSRAGQRGDRGAAGGGIESSIKPPEEAVKRAVPHPLHPEPGRAPDLTRQQLRRRWFLPQPQSAEF